MGPGVGLVWLLNNLRIAELDLSDLINGLVGFVGVAILLPNNGWLTLDVSLLWKLFVPAVLFWLGASLLMGGVRRPGSRTHFMIMSGAKEVQTGPLTDMAIIAVMGGANST